MAKLNVNYEQVKKLDDELRKFIHEHTFEELIHMTALEALDILLGRVPETPRVGGRTESVRTCEEHISAIKVRVENRRRNNAATLFAWPKHLF